MNGAPRRAITTNTQPIRWTDDWHRVMLRRRADGLVKVFFDDMQEPLMSVANQRFQKGRIGIGSFDDMNDFDDIRVYGR